jgi:hypothetical protein
VIAPVAKPNTCVSIDSATLDRVASAVYKVFELAGVMGGSDGQVELCRRAALAAIVAYTEKS